MFAQWSAHALLREEVRQLIPVLESRADALPQAGTLAPEIPLVVHGRYLGPVQPGAHRGERPITIEWELATPLLPEWVRRWGNVT